MWMLCEGLYLHTLLVVAFVQERLIMRYLYVIGWVFPAVIISIYAVCRGTLQDSMQRAM
jgi:calcitonin receptor-like